VTSTSRHGLVRQPTIEELATQYLDPLLDVYGTIQIYEEMCRRFSTSRADQALSDMREIMKMIGVKT